MYTHGNRTLCRDKAFLIFTTTVHRWQRQGKELELTWDYRNVASGSGAGSCEYYYWVGISYFGSESPPQIQILWEGVDPDCSNSVAVACDTDTFTEVFCLPTQKSAVPLSRGPSFGSPSPPVPCSASLGSFEFNTI